MQEEAFTSVVDCIQTLIVANYLEVSSFLRLLEMNSLIEAYQVNFKGAKYV